MWKVHPLPIFSNNRPLIMAHRGDSSNVPENSFRAFEDAYDLKVDCLETDVHMTKDGEFVLFHDKTLDRTTNGSGKISDYTLSKLKEFDTGYQFHDKITNSYPFRGRGYQIHTVEEILPKFPNIRFNLDIKSKNSNAPQLLAKKLLDLGLDKRIIVGSFHQKQIKRFRNCSEIPTSGGPIEVFQLLWKFSRMKKLWPKYLQEMNLPTSNEEIAQNQRKILKRELQFYALQIPEAFGKIKIISPEFIQFLHLIGINVHVWTINKSEDMERLLEWGVDGIFTDHPSILLKIWEEFKKN